MPGRRDENLGSQPRRPQRRASVMLDLGVGETDFPWLVMKAKAGGFVPGEFFEVSIDDSGCRVGRRSALRFPPRRMARPPPAGSRREEDYSKGCHRPTENAE